MVSLEIIDPALVSGEHSFTHTVSGTDRALLLVDEDSFVFLVISDSV